MEIGIIGAGWWATKAYLPLLRGHPLVSGIAVCRPDSAGLDRLRSEAGITHGFTDAAAMLRARPLAGVIVASPHDLHAEHALAAITRRLPVLIEKPMATSSGDARRIAEAAARSPAPVLVAYGWNFRPIAAAALRLIRDGWVGEVMHVACSMATATTELFSGREPPGAAGSLFSPAAATWADPRRAGGYGWGQLTHALGLLFLLVDRDPVRAFARMRPSVVDVDLCDAGVIELEGGTTVAVSGTAALPRGMRRQLELRLFGREGTLFLDMERVRLEAIRADGRRHAEALSEADGDYAVAELIDRFVRLCAGEPVDNAANVAVGRRAVDALDAMYRSAASGQAEAVETGPATVASPVTAG